MLLQLRMQSIRNKFEPQMNPHKTFRGEAAYHIEKDKEYTAQEGSNPYWLVKNIIGMSANGKGIHARKNPLDYWSTLWGNVLSTSSF